MGLKTGPLHGQKIPGGYRIGQYQKFTPEQMDLYKQMFGMVGPESYLGKLAAGDEEMFRQIEKPALQQFAGEVGQLGSRFSGMGMGAQKSSGFRNTATQAAADFAGKLQAQRQGLQRQAISDLMGFSNQLMGISPYETYQYERKHHGPSSAGKGKMGAGGWLGTLGGGALGFLTGGPLGAASGAFQGYNLSRGGGGGGGFGFQGSPGWDFNQWALNMLPGGV